MQHSYGSGGHSGKSKLHLRVLAHFDKTQHRLGTLGTTCALFIWPFKVKYSAWGCKLRVPKLYLSV